jgi:hypothetical protein
MTRDEETLMHRLLHTVIALTALVTVRRPRDERGDVPGWVLVTVMTAGLVAALWAVAGPELERMLRQALQSVA